VTVIVPVEIRSASNIHEAHWSQRHKRVKRERLATWAALAKAGVRALGPDEAVRVRLTRIAPRAIDGHDNLQGGFKAVVDQITACLGLASDADPRVSWDYGQERGGVRQYMARVEIERAAGKA
jgi:hypothetical protein